MKICIFCICISTIFNTFSQSVAAQERELRDLVLWERSYHLYIEMDHINLAINKDAMLVEYIDSLTNKRSHDLLERFYDFGYATYPDKIDLFQVFMNKNVVVVYNDTSENIRSSKLLFVMTAFEGQYGVIELGDRLVDNVSGEWTAWSESGSIGSFYQKNTIPEVCTSFYFVPPVEPSRPVEYVNAVFFIEEGSDVMACFDRLFLDLIGLRGLAVQFNTDEGAQYRAIDNIKALENNYTFRKQ